MSDLREAAQQALEALEAVCGESCDATHALRAALAEPEQRPISTVTEAVTKTVIEVEKMLCEKLGRRWQLSGMSIQTLVDELESPPARKPLTDDEILEMVRAAPALGSAEDEWLHVARAIERAHGIGEGE